jgi:hypothetical protein
VFDFFGAGRPPASEPEPAPAEAFNPAFDFFGGASQSSTPPPAEVELSSAAPAATRQSTSPRKSKSVPPAASFTTESFPAAAPLAAPEDGGSFRITAAVASPSESRDEDPIPYADFHADVPMAAPVFDEEVPFAAPASAVGIAVLTGPEVALQPDGSAAPTGGTAALSLDGGWLVARGGGEETYLRLGRLEAVALRDRPGAGLVLSVHAGGQAVAVRCDEDAEPARAFLRRVLAAAG